MQKLAKLVKFHGAVYWLFHIILIWCSVFFKHQVQFRHLPQLGVSQLLEDMVGEDANECCKCRSVTNCKLISFCELNIVGAW